ncbi:LOW QUALITY PROTEIN: mas-related G-protein coupled receptor member X1-like [Gracilinanus agilis]|uniref:LOW QUALITY PROTEIN: mas-related G-protein coupled receptor member X1-like n=1 Tax=Gracilinanus agilis TaxID=191870 RepID=UPI001CFF2849|nr:LOW QUALITY PROTEIN: mas-related G-protein coupled receptor member X1-like [Gracilinanus agilis]
MAVSTTPEQWESVLDITEQTRTNSSLDPVDETPGEFAYQYWRETLSLVIALVGLVGNSIVLWLLGFRIQRSPFSVYILNLAAADALLLGSYSGFCVGEIVAHLYTSGLRILWSCILYMSHCVGLSLLAAISTERCLSGLFPIWYRCHQPKYTSATVCAVLWALQGLYWGALVALNLLSNFHVFQDFYLSLPFIGIGWFSLLTCVLCISSLTLVLSIQFSSQRRRPPRLYLLILLTVLVFLLCGLPLGIIGSINSFSYTIVISNGSLRLLACVNSSANPFIYFFLGSQWHKRGREPLRVVLQRALGEEQVGGQVGRRDTSHPNTLYQ